MPAHYWAVVGQAKQSAAATLAYAPGGPFDRQGPHRAESATTPLIVQQSYGLGQVLYVGLDSTWRRAQGWATPTTASGARWRGWAADPAGEDEQLLPAIRRVRAGLPERTQDVELSVRFNELKDAAKAGPGAAGAEVRGAAATAGPPLAVVELNRKDQADALEPRVPNLPTARWIVRLKMDAAPEEMTQTRRRRGRTRSRVRCRRSMRDAAGERGDGGPLSGEPAAGEQGWRPAAAAIYTPENARKTW